MPFLDVLSPTIDIVSQILPRDLFKRQNGPVLHGRIGVGQALAQGGNGLWVFDFSQGSGGGQSDILAYVAA